MTQEVKCIENKPFKQSAGSLTKNVLLIILATTMFSTGFYSLFLASIYSDPGQNFTTDNLFRTADPSEIDKIETAFGHFSESDFMYLILDKSMPEANPDLELSARSAARLLSDSGLITSVRLLFPEDIDFKTIIAQNDIDRFPTVLAVKKEGGIIKIEGNHSQDYLLFAYNSIWGKTSDCSDDKSAIY